MKREFTEIRNTDPYNNITYRVTNGDKTINFECMNDNRIDYNKFTISKYQYHKDICLDLLMSVIVSDERLFFGTKKKDADIVYDDNGMISEYKFVFDFDRSSYTDRLDIDYGKDDESYYNTTVDNNDIDDKTFDMLYNNAYMLEIRNGLLLIEDAVGIIIFTVGLNNNNMLNEVIVEKGEIK